MAFLSQSAWSAPGRVQQHDSSDQIRALVRVPQGEMVKQKYITCSRRGCKGWTWDTGGAKHCDQCGVRFRQQQHQYEGTQPRGHRGVPSSHGVSTEQPPQQPPEEQPEKPGRWRSGRGSSRGPSFPPGLRRPAASVSFSGEGDDQPQAEDPIALAQAQVSFWKKWKPSGEEHNAALGKLKQAKAAVLASKSLDQQAQSLAGQLDTQKQKFTAQSAELKQLLHIILDTSEQHKRILEEAQITKQEIQSLESQFNMAKQAAMQAATKDEDLLSTLQGVLAARMPPGSKAPPELRSKVLELAGFFDDLTEQHEKAVAPPKDPTPRTSSDVFPAVGEAPEEGWQAAGAAGAFGEPPTDSGTAAAAADATRAGEAVPCPQDPEFDAMDQSLSLVRAAHAISSVAEGMAAIQGHNGPEAKKAKAAATEAEKTAKAAKAAQSPQRL